MQVGGASGPELESSAAPLPPPAPRRAVALPAAQEQHAGASGGCAEAAWEPLGGWPSETQVLILLSTEPDRRQNPLESWTTFYFILFFISLF